MRCAKPTLWVAVGAAAALLLASDGVWAQCAMCRTALLKSPEGQELAQGFNTGILFLLSAPFMVGGVIAFAIIRARLGESLRGGPAAVRMRSRRSSLSPPEHRDKDEPCHFIPLNERGDTIASLENQGDRDKLETALLTWLYATVSRLEKELAREEEAIAKSPVAGEADSRSLGKRA